MTRLLAPIILAPLLFLGCASPSGSGDTYGSPEQQARMQQDTTMGPGLGGSSNDGQGYKGNSGLGSGKTVDKF